MTNKFIRDVKEVIRRLRNRGISFDANRQYPAVPTIDNTIESHTNALRALREAVETHERRNPKAALDSFVRLYELEDVLGGFQPVNDLELDWATHEEVDAGAPRFKAVDPETGAYAYDRLRHVGQHTAGKGTAVVTLVPAANVVTVDRALSNVFDLTVGDDYTMADPLNPINGQTFNIFFRQTETGGKTITSWGSMWTFANKIDPVLTTDPNAVDLLSCQWDPISSKVRCSFIPNYGAGFTAPDPPAASDLVFVNVGGGNGIYRDTVGLNVNLRTIVGTGDIDVSIDGEGRIAVNYTAPATNFGTLNDITDVDTAGVTNGQVLGYDSGTLSWIPMDPPFVGALADLTDVSETAPTGFQVLAWDADASLWAPTSINVQGSPTTTLGDLIRRGADEDERLGIGTAGQVLTVVSGQPAWADAAGGAMPEFMRGAAFVSATPLTAAVAPVSVFIDRAATIKRVVVLGDVSGSVAVGIKKIAVGSYSGPTSGSSIVASDPPSISSGIQLNKTTFTGWTLGVAIGDVLNISLSSVATMKRVTVQIFFEETG